MKENVLGKGKFFTRERTKRQRNHKGKLISLGETHFSHTGYIFSLGIENNSIARREDMSLLQNYL